MHGLRATPLVLSLAIHAAVGLAVLAFSNSASRRTTARPAETVLTLVPAEIPAPNTFPGVSTAADQPLCTLIAQLESARPSAAPLLHFNIGWHGTPPEVIRATAQSTATTARVNSQDQPNLAMESDAALAVTASNLPIGAVGGIAGVLAPAPATPARPALPASQATLVPAHLHSPAPTYPRVALQHGAEGVVLLDVVVGETGEPLKVALKRSSGHRALDTAALRAVERWRFRPARAGGAAVIAAVEVPLRFQLKP